MRRFWPLTLALFCWLLLLLIPATRNGVRRAWIVAPLYGGDSSDYVDVAPFKRISLDDAALLKRYPGNRDVTLYAARTNWGENGENLDVLARLYPRDAYVVSLQIGRDMRGLFSGRGPGPLTASDFPPYPKGSPIPDPLPKASPPEQWQKVIDLARRGQRLQPNNTYFDWVLLHALLATKRDDEAHRVIALAAKKTGFNAFERDAILNEMAYKRLALGSPLSPRELLEAQLLRTPDNVSILRKTTRWGMETVIADRQAGRHERAIDTTFGLAKMGRIMRREGYSITAHVVGTDCEAIAFGNAAVPPKNVRSSLRVGASLGQFQSAPGSLYAYAKAQGRSELLPVLDAEWMEMGQWYKAIRNLRTGTWDIYSKDDMAMLIVADRMRALLMHALPLVVVVGVVFGLLSWRFPNRSRVVEGVGVPSGWTRGVVVGVLLLLIVVGLDTMVSLSADGAGVYGDWTVGYLYFGLLQSAPAWIWVGVGGGLLCFALSATVGWQKRRTGEARSFKEELGRTFHGNGDGVANFDFGWLFSWVVRLTIWAIAFAALVWVLRRSMYEGPRYLWMVPVGIVLFSLFLHFLTWRKRPHRRETLLLSFRLVGEAMAGFFVLASLLYGLIAFATLPKAMQFERDFEAAMRQGELKLARVKLGL